MRNPKDWTRELNASLQQGIRRGGLQHLLTGYDIPQRGMAFLGNHGNGLLAIGIGLSILEKSIPFQYEGFRHVLLYNLANVVGYTAAGISSEGIEKDGRGYRVNLFPGFEIDRALLLLHATRKSRPLLKVIE